MAGPPPHHHHHHHHHHQQLVHLHHHHHHHRHHPCYPPPTHLHPPLLFCPCHCHHPHYHPNPNPNPIPLLPFPLPSLSRSTNLAGAAPLNHVSPDNPVASGNRDGLQQQDLVEEVELEDEDGEDIFVLTDEWMEFFAKSEAKRQLEKQNKRKKGRK